MTDPQAVRDATLAVPGVTGMHPGRFGTAATFSANGRVWGVRLAPGRLDVHVVAATGGSLTSLGRAIQHAVRRTDPDYAGDIVVHIEDLTAPPPTDETYEVAADVGRDHPEDPRRTP